MIKKQQMIAIKTSTINANRSEGIWLTTYKNNFPKIKLMWSKLTNLNKSLLILRKNTMSVKEVTSR